MKADRTTSRRSFLRRVGATATAGAAFALVGGSEAGAQGRPYTGVRDCDSGQGADPDGYGRGVRNQFTDRDSGPGADRACHGRGSSTGSTGTEYHPSSDPNTGPATGCSDTDYGEYGDPGGHGRRCRGGYGTGAPQLSGCTDRDSGSGADSIGNGRHCTPR